MNSKLRHAIFVSTMTLGTMGTLSLTACSDTEDPETTVQPVEQETIAAIAAADDRFTTLVAALTEAELVETFASEGSYTVFAPTDDAFAALPEGVLDQLLADKELLTQVLTYHVVGSTVLADDVVTLSSAATLEGSEISIEVVDGGVVLDGEVNVIITDIEASNGVIHVIDAVLLPEGFELPETETPEDTTAVEAETIAAIAAGNPDFSTLVTALEEAELVEVLNGETEYTVFAPTNAAFDALPEGALEGLLADKEALSNVLLYHVVEGKVDAATVVTLDEATAAQEGKISIEVVDGEVILNGTVKVVTTDIEASNGIIHVIDAVLLPEAEPEEPEAPTQTITEIAAADSNFSTLVTALQDVGLDEVLNGTDEYTVFAPTNAAFDALPAGTVQALLDGPDADLTEVLLNHVVAGKVDAATVVGLTNAKTADGARISIEVVEGEVIINGEVKVTSTDIMATNGIIHVIDAVILPKGNIVETAVAAGTFTQLADALVATGLDSTLSNEENFYTVFAPTDDAFAKIQSTVDGLTTEQLTNVLLAHVVAADADAAAVLAESSHTTVGGEVIDVVVDGNTITIGGATLSTTDIFTSNGVIHVLDDVIIPSSL